MKGATLRWYDAWVAPRPREVGLAALAASALHDRNPSSLHGSGRSARRRLDALGDILAQRVGLERSEIDVIITGSGREAMALASTYAEGFEVSTATGRNPAQLPLRLDPKRSRARRLWAPFDDRDGELSSIQAVRDRSSKDQGLVVDATLALGRVDLVEFCAEAELVVFAGETTGAPPGIGALLRRRGVDLVKAWGGGAQEHGVRPGTQNPALAAAWSAALEADERREWLATAVDTLAGALVKTGAQPERGKVPGLLFAWVNSIDERQDFRARLKARGAVAAPVERDKRLGLRFCLEAGMDDDELGLLDRAIRLG